MWKAASAAIYNAASDIERKVIDARFEGTGSEPADAESVGEPDGGVDESEAGSVAESETLAEYECVAEQRALDAAHDTFSKAHQPRNPRRRV